MVALLAAIPGLALGQNPTREESIGIFRAAVEKIRSYDLVIRVRIKHGGEGPGKSHPKPEEGAKAEEKYASLSRQMKENDRLRVDVYSPMNPRTVIQSCVAGRDKQVSVHYGQERGLIDKASGDFIPDGMFYDQLYRTDIANTPLDHIFDLRRKVTAVWEVKYGKQLLVIEAPPEKNTDLDPIGFRTR
jgi:hypothetical protein